MRLVPPRPSLRKNLPFSSLGPNIADNSKATLPVAPLWEAEGAHCGLGSTTLFPSSFGTIYAGETFKAVVTLANVVKDTETSTLICEEPEFRIQRPGNNISVAIESNADNEDGFVNGDVTNAKVLKRGENVARVVKVHLDSPGAHVLVCAANYDGVGAKSKRKQIAEGEASQRKNLLTARQSFRFNVSASMESKVVVRDLRRRSRTNDDQGEESGQSRRWLVEAHVKNLMQVPVVWWHGEIKTDEKQRINVRLLGGSSKEEMMENENCREIGIERWGKMSTETGDTRGFVFEIVENDAIDQDKNRYADTEKKLLGNLRVLWRSSHGEKGQLNNAAAIYTPIVRTRPIDIRVVSVPPGVRTHHQFAARCLATNNTTRSVRLHLAVQRKRSVEILPVGVNEQYLGELSPGAEIECQVVLLPLSAGKHPIDGISVIDMDTEKVYDAIPPVIRVS